MKPTRLWRDSLHRHVWTLSRIALTFLHCNVLEGGGCLKSFVLADYATGNTMGTRRKQQDQEENGRHSHDHVRKMEMPDKPR